MMTITIQPASIVILFPLTVLRMGAIVTGSRHGQPDTKISDFFEIPRQISAFHALTGVG